MCLYKVILKTMLSRKRISYFVIPSLILCVIFIIYQFTIFWQLLNSENEVKIRPRAFVRGTHELESEFYKPSANKQFQCIKSMEQIEFTKVNDNYCDCLDETDEPGTNACPNGVFYCSKYTKSYPKKVPSNKVNDGICDCCDGSDEYAHNQVLLGHLKREVQKKLNFYHVPCPHLC